jgi:hypothetical protein
MNKDISIKLQLEDLGLITDVLQSITYTAWTSATPEQRVAISLSKSVSKKLRKKIIDKEGIHGKEFKVKFTYPEAFALFTLLHSNKWELEIDPHDYFSDTRIKTITNQLHQELI